MIQIKSGIVSNERLNKDCRRVKLEAPQIAAEVKPGQFVNVKIGGNDPLFRRPLCVFRCVRLENGERGIELIYQVVGRGTRLMTDLKPGDELDVIGPLGHGFEWDRNKKVHVLLTSGIGASAVFMLGEEISRAATERNLELNILLDARTKQMLILEDEFKTLNGKIMVSTHDGTRGYCGYVTDMLKDAIDEGEISSDCVIYACGPEPMFKALAAICRQYHIPAQVSIERHMMCGIGACLVCVCKIDKDAVMKYRDLKASHIQLTPQEEFGYALTCKDGPVFNIDEVIFDE